MQRYIKKILEARVYGRRHRNAPSMRRAACPNASTTGYCSSAKMSSRCSPSRFAAPYNKMSQLTAEEKARGVITASAGNHAQGVAASARRLGIKATIVMPKTTPEVKVSNVRRLGGRAVLHGDHLR